ncbi:Aklanonic acid methyltransferase DnrC [Cytospora mali]|uniref:Aklanonic acid methyltransferase DnrC n=1 Tax=Cytospora mali TaxID=578113 RepID=A0A194UTR0_CYTMA|nr:Aklanonic acid methyltransferase DnrC [Valsa mali var. pyri (nom. inval.)]
MSAPTETVLPLSSAERIATYQLLPPNGLAIEVAQATHRINLINTWGPTIIFPGARVLEIGCGQGNCTAVLAEAVGPQGNIDAFDPAPPDYGSPFTLAQAQAHISQSEIGKRVTWHRGKPLREPHRRDDPAGKVEEAGWDVAVLTHCIWYFKRPEELKELLSYLADGIKAGGKVCIAEYALRATEMAAVPHLLAALARGTLEAHRESNENIQNLVSPGEIKEVAMKCRWKLDSEALLVPGKGLMDGQWETRSVVTGRFGWQMEESPSLDDENRQSHMRVESVLRSARAAVLAAVEVIGGIKETRTMDVWTGVFSVDPNYIDSSGLGEL